MYNLNVSLSLYQYLCPFNVINLFILLPLRMASPEQSANSSSQTGLSKECQKLEKASLISSDRCTKPRNSLDRTDQSLYTAGKKQRWHRITAKTRQICSLLQRFTVHFMVSALISCQASVNNSHWYFKLAYNLFSKCIKYKQLRNWWRCTLYLTFPVISCILILYHFSISQCEKNHITLYF